MELGVFAELAKAPANVDTLSRGLGLHARSARDFLDALVALRMLERTDGIYRNTPATDFYLDPAKPSYVGGLLEMANARLYGFWGSLTEALRTGAPQNESKDGGADLFAALYADPERLKGFLRAMSGISAGPAQAIRRRRCLARLYVLHGCRLRPRHGPGDAGAYSSSSHRLWL